MNVSNANLRSKIKSDIKSLLNDSLISKDSGVVNDLTTLLHDLDHNEYRITILGEFSSGKSTFLDALIGQDILPHGVEETTAAVTYIHNISKNNPKKNKVEVFFRDENKEKEVLDLSKSNTALIDYVTAKAKDKDVVKDIAEVHLYLNFMEGEENLVLIDTPGLNGIKDGMRDITYREIHRSHANICLFNIKGASRSDLDFIENFYKQGTPFFFVLNQIDNLKDNEETPEQKIKDFTESVKNNILHIDTVPSNVFGVSALQALAARDERIKRLYNDSDLLTSNDRKNLLKASRMETFETALYNFVKTGDIERNYIKQVKARVLSILTTAKKSALEEIELLKAKVSNIPEKELLIQQQKQVEKKFEDNKKIIRNRLGSLMADLEQSSIKEVYKICENIAEGANRIVNNWTNLEMAEKDVKQGKVIKYINDSVAERREMFAHWLTPKFNSIYNQMIDVVRNFVPSVKFSPKNAQWQFFYENEKVVDESKLDRIERDIKEKQKELQEKRETKQRVDEKRRYFENKIYETQRKLYQNERERNWELTKQGYRPEYRSWRESRIVEKWFLFIPYDSTEYYTVDNSDDIREWDQKTEKINRTYDGIETNLRATKANYEREKRNHDSSMYDSMIRQLDLQLSALNKRKQEEEAEIALQRKVARGKRFNNLKAHSRKIIDGSITPHSGTLYLALKEDVQRSINNAEESMAKELNRTYVYLIDTFKQNVRLLIQKIENKLDTESINKRMTYLTDLSSRITGYLGKLNNQRL